MLASNYPTLKATILAETDPVFVALRQTNETGQLAAWYNEIASPNFTVWRSVVNTSEILNGISGANLTPADTADGTNLHLERVLICKSKQMNLQLYLQTERLLPTGKTNIRQALQDSLLNVPAGPNGTLLDAGWTGAGKVKATISRLVNRAERIFASGAGTASNPGDLGAHEGGISNEDIIAALRS